MGKRTRIDGAPPEGGGEGDEGDLRLVGDEEDGPVPPRLAGMPLTRLRLRELRRELRPRVSQRILAERLGTHQVWVSRRENGKPEPSVEEAILMAEGLGYAAAFLIVPAEQAELLSVLTSADPEDTAMALRLLRALPNVKEGTRDMIERMVNGAETQASETVAR